MRLDLTLTTVAVEIKEDRKIDAEGSNVLARHGVAIGRNPRWIEDANAEQIARVNEAVAALRQK